MVMPKNSSSGAATDKRRRRETELRDDTEGLRRQRQGALRGSANR